MVYLLKIYVCIVILILITDMLYQVLNNDFNGVRCHLKEFFTIRGGEIILIPILHIVFLVVNILVLIETTIEKIIK